MKALGILAVAMGSLQAFAGDLIVLGNAQTGPGDEVERLREVAMAEVLKSASDSQYQPISDWMISVDPASFSPRLGFLTVTARASFIDPNDTGPLYVTVRTSVSATGSWEEVLKRAKPSLRSEAFFFCDSEVTDPPALERRLNPYQAIWIVSGRFRCESQ